MIFNIDAADTRVTSGEAGRTMADWCYAATGVDLKFTNDLCEAMYLLVHR